MAIIFTSIDRCAANKGRRALKEWITSAVKEEKHTLGEIVIAFCSDSYIHKTNLEFLQHNYPTDIITFDNSSGQIASADLLISVETVASNAERFAVTFDDELLRVMIHGVLHITGYDDHTDEDRLRMRAREDYYIQKFKNKAPQPQPDMSKE